MPSRKVATYLAKVRPPRAGHLLGTYYEIKTATPRVSINHQAATPATIRRHREIYGESGRPDSPATPEYGGDSTIADRPLGALAKRLHKPALTVGQLDNMLSTHLDSKAPHVALTSSVGIARFAVT
jgi:hypothetical protein